MALRTLTVVLVLAVAAVAAAQPCIQCSVRDSFDSVMYVHFSTLAVSTNIAANQYGGSSARPKVIPDHLLSIHSDDKRLKLHSQCCLGCASGYVSSSLITATRPTPHLTLLQVCTSDNCRRNCQRECPPTVNINWCRIAGVEAGRKVARESCEITGVSVSYRLVGGTVLSPHQCTYCLQQQHRHE